MIDVSKLSRADAEKLKTAIQARFDREDEVKDVVDELTKLVADFVQNSKLYKTEAHAAVKAGVEKVRWTNYNSF